MLERIYLRIYDGKIIIYFVSFADFHTFLRFQYERYFVQKIAQKVTVVAFAFGFVLSVKGPETHLYWAISICVNLKDILLHNVPVLWFHLGEFQRWWPGRHCCSMYGLTSTKTRGILYKWQFCVKYSDKCFVQQSNLSSNSKQIHG
jgi:hypothetical protein